MPEDGLHSEIEIAISSAAAAIQELVRASHTTRHGGRPQADLMAALMPLRQAVVSVETAIAGLEG